MRRFVLALCLALLATGCGDAHVHAQSDPYASGGPLSTEQASYNVTFYDLELRVDPSDSTIAGALTASVRVVQPTRWLVFDLDPILDVESVALVDVEMARVVPFERRGGKLWVDLLLTRQPASTVSVRVAYGGRPRVAPNPPWDGGFTWARTLSGEPWIATSCQVNGADLWWPVKDHPSDEPDSMAIRITVPNPLVVASNGRLENVTPADEGWTTYHWFVSTPINVYNVALNIAPYRVIEETHQSVTGETFPLVFYALPEDYENALNFLPEIRDHLRFFEERFGPYPFRADKYGVAQTPFLGMEHQTIIAYGANFRNDAMTGRDWGFDALHHHELAHEWWGNLVSAHDWSDMWLHEGFATYTQALYMEELGGMDGYQAYMNSMRGFITNREPVAPRRSLTSVEIYGGDVYYKGAWILHTLRYLVGDETMDRLLRRMAYPDPAMERVTDGTQCRFASTDDFLFLAEAISGRELGWFFELYLRQERLPRLDTRREADRLVLEWRTPNGMPFPMPIEVQVDGRTRRVEMRGGSGSIDVPPGVEIMVDPDGWVLREAR